MCNLLLLLWPLILFISVPVFSLNRNSTPSFLIFLLSLELSVVISLWLVIQIASAFVRGSLRPCLIPLQGTSLPKSHWKGNERLKTQQLRKAVFGEEVKSNPPSGSCHGDVCNMGPCVIFPVQYPSPDAGALEILSGIFDQIILFTFIQQMCFLNTHSQLVSLTCTASYALCRSSEETE